MSSEDLGFPSGRYSVAGLNSDFDEFNSYDDIPPPPPQVSFYSTPSPKQPSSFSNNAQRYPQFQDHSSNHYDQYDEYSHQTAAAAAAPKKPASRNFFGDDDDDSEFFESKAPQSYQRNNSYQSNQYSSNPLNSSYDSQQNITRGYSNSNNPNTNTPKTAQRVPQDNFSANQSNGFGGYEEEDEAEIRFRQRKQQQNRFAALSDEVEKKAEEDERVKHQQIHHQKAPTPAASGGSQLEVKLVSGKIHGEGMSAYVTFIVHTKTTLPQFRQREFSQSRRYRDFLWLHKHLQAYFKGIIIPPLPEKDLLNKFSPDFIEFRRRELEKFIKRVVAHPVLATSSHLQTFLEAPDYEMKEIKETQQSGGFMTSMSNFLGVKVMNSLAPAIETDSWFEQRTRYVYTLEAQLNIIINNVSACVVKTSELAEVNRNIGSSVVQLSRSEAPVSPVLSNSFSRLGEAHSSIDILNREYATLFKVSLEDTFRDYVRIIDAIKVMLSHRLERLASYQDVVANSKSKRDRLERLRREGGSVPIALSHEIERIDAIIQRERDSFETISRMCRKELENFEATKTKEIHNAILQYVQASLDYQLRVTDLWKNYLKTTPEL